MGVHAGSSNGICACVRPPFWISITHKPPAPGAGEIITDRHVHFLFRFSCVFIAFSPNTKTHTHTGYTLLQLIDLSQPQCILTFRGRYLKSLLLPQTHSRSQTQPRVLQTNTHTHTQQPVVSYPPPLHSPNRLREYRRQGLHTRKYTPTHLLSLCIININEPIDVQQRQRSRQSFPQSE